MINFKEKKVLIFDIEVAAYDFETYFDDEIKEYLLKYAKDDEERKKTIESLVFTSFTSELLCIGMMDYNENKGSVLINTNEKIEIESEKENVAVFHDVLFTFKTVLAGFFDGLFRFVSEKIFTVISLGTDETFFKVGVNDTRSLRRFGAGTDGPCAHFFFTSGEVSLQSQKLVSFTD